MWDASLLDAPEPPAHKGGSDGTRCPAPPNVRPSIPYLYPPPPRRRNDGAIRQHSSTVRSHAFERSSGSAAIQQFKLKPPQAPARATGRHLARGMHQCIRFRRTSTIRQAGAPVAHSRRKGIRRPGRPRPTQPPAAGPQHCSNERPLPLSAGPRPRPAVLDVAAPAMSNMPL